MSTDGPGPTNGERRGPRRPPDQCVPIFTPAGDETGLYLCSTFAPLVK